ncbi:unnamed protein product, partial [Rotaria sp. Silwood2]
MPKGLFQF